MCKTLRQEEFGIRRADRRPRLRRWQDSRRLEWDGARPGRGNGLERTQGPGQWGVMQCSELDQTNIWAVDGEISTQ